MAKPAQRQTGSADGADAPWLEAVGADRLTLRIKVQPGASRTEVGETLGDRLKIRVQAPPVEGAANAALLKWLAKTLGVSKGKVRLAQGERSRDKTVEVTGVDAETARRALGTPIS